MSSVRASKTAKFDGMPGSAQAAGVVDEALIPEEMGVALTGYGQQSDVDKALAAGFDRHLTKPVDPALLARLLTSLPR